MFQYNFFQNTGCRISNTMCFKKGTAFDLKSGTWVSRARTPPVVRDDVTRAPENSGNPPVAELSEAARRERESRRRQTVGAETDKKREGNTVTERLNPVTQPSVTLDVGRRSGEGIWVAFFKLSQQPRSGSVNTAAVSIES